MTESSTQSGDAQSDSGIVITGGLDDADQEPSGPEVEPEDGVDADNEEAESVPAEADQEADDDVGGEQVDAPEEGADGEAEGAQTSEETACEDDDGETDIEEVSNAESSKEVSDETDGMEDSEAASEAADSAESTEAVTEDAAADGGSAAASDDAPEDGGGESESADNNDEATETDTDATDLGEVSHPPKHLSATVKAGELDDFIDNVSVLVEECKIRTSPDGLSIKAVDPANVGMVDADLDAEAFEGFDTTRGVLGVSLDRLEEVVSLADAGDLVTLNYDTETRKLHIEAAGVEYTLALIDPDSIRQEPEIPDLGNELPAHAELETSDMSRGIKAADMVSDHIALKTEMAGRSGELLIEAEGDTDDVDLRLGGDDLVSESIDAEVTSLFSLEYLKDIKKALPSNGTVGIKLGNEYPIKLLFSNEEETQHVEFMIAPRISSD